MNEDTMTFLFYDELDEEEYPCEVCGDYGLDVEYVACFMANLCENCYWVRIEDDDE